MKTRTKVLTSVIAIMLSCVLLFMSIVICNNTNNFAAVSASTRTVELNGNTVDYATFFNEFENAELVIDEENNALKFSGTKKLDADLFNELDLIGLTNYNDGIDVRYIFDYNADTNEFYLTVVADTENGEIIDNWFGVPFTTESGEIDISFATDDGIIYLSELEESGILENCGWFSKILKKVAIAAVIVAAVAVVVAVAVVAAPAIAAAATTVATAVSVGGGAAALTAGTATAAVAAAAAAGSAAMATTAFALATTTAAVATAIAAGAYVADRTLQLVDDLSFINPLKDIRELAESIVKDIKNLTKLRVYQFAYLSKAGLVILPTKLNYLEAYAVLIATGFVNYSATGALTVDLQNFVLPTSLATLVNTIKSKSIKAGYVGIYTATESDAAKLAYAAGGFFRGEMQSEIHDKTIGSGYYFHFHDFTHSIHVWYGTAV